ncbi:SOS response-associated peptidase [Dyadobacter fanqingshengii]|uniref:Abasic site processing protein n=1 Tax=Dyadobacter fanqingshengii TaxID=2906443 RepID=A0A9X1PGW3_9BACT|nr:SOS response-associated peptidase family protein [Dyadobacter fanqingshengii]MCF0043648.1 SOS response-associated peptidase [Dyadobacter fanqingshengii]USJ34736.1 SOS response-associated peptidase [Dyadobacter fanqingshengii]
MCYHVSQQKTVEQIKIAFHKPIDNRELYRQAYHVNAFEDPFQPVISNWDAAKIDMYRWRLIPSDKTEANFKANTRNAKSETLFSLSSFKDYWFNRCLIICTGFFEPHLVDPKKPTHSYYIKPKEKEFITLGGIFSPWNGIKTYTVITTPATPLLSEIHNEGKRMPLVLEGEKAEEWMAPPKSMSQQRMAELMAPYENDDDWMAFRTINGITNSYTDTNVPEVLWPYEEKALPYTDLPLFRDLEGSK